MVKKATKSKKKSKRKNGKSFFKKHPYWGFLFKCGCIVFALLFLYIGYCYVTLPDVEDAVSHTRQPSTTIIAENGNEILTFGNSFSEVVYLDDLPYYVPAAIIDVEDRRFYSHFGFDVIGFARAIGVNIIKGRYAQGTGWTGD